MGCFSSVMVMVFLFVVCLLVRSNVDCGAYVIIGFLRDESLLYIVDVGEYGLCLWREHREAGG